MSMSSPRGPLMMAAPAATASARPPAAPPAATRVTRLRGPKWPSFGALSRTRHSRGRRRSRGGRAEAAAVGAAIIDGPLRLDIEAAPRLEAVLDFQKVCAQNMPQRPSSTLHKHICLQAALARCLHALNARYIAHDIYACTSLMHMAGCDERQGRGGAGQNGL